MMCLVLGLASAQSDCSLFTIDILGSTTNLSTEGLLARSVAPVGETTVEVPVKIMNYRILCDASGRRRDTSSYVSLLVELQCFFEGGSGNLADCDGVTNITRQYQYRCSDSNVWENAGVVETLNPTATFQTEVTNQCRLCVDPTEIPALTDSIDPDTHCVGKYLSLNCTSLWTIMIIPLFLTACDQTQCNQGQARCYVDSVVERCCNFYLEGVCQPAECPSPLVPNNDTFDCGILLYKT